jgi:hypothetical protein
MSRKDFILIAETILHLNVDADTRAKVAEGFADSLRRTNGAFKRELFIQAATGKCPLTARVPR